MALLTRNKKFDMSPDLDAYDAYFYFFINQIVKRDLFPGASAAWGGHWKGRK